MLRALRAIAMAVAVASVAACSHAGKAVLTRDLPAPDRRLVQPADVPEPQEDEELLEIAARERAGRFDNQRKLEAMDQWYAKVRRQYQGAK